jgi:hypothetical protein
MHGIQVNAVKYAQERASLELVISGYFIVRYFLQASWRLYFTGYVVHFLDDYFLVCWM